MCAPTTAQQDSPIDLTPPVCPSMPWRVLEVDALSNYRLRVRFIDGLEGTVDPQRHCVESQSKPAVRSCLARDGGYGQGQH